jgi:mono/diheme cytochrome c family protein
MPAMRLSPSRGVFFPGLLAVVWLSACLPDPTPIDTGAGGTTATGMGGSDGSGFAGTTGGGGVVGTGGDTGAAGTTVTGAGGSAAGGRGGGTGGTSSGGRGGASSGGRGGASSGGRGGASSGGAGAGGTSSSTGGSSGDVPAAFVICTPCHGNDGTGVSGKGVDIQHPVVDYSTWVIRNGRVHPDFPEPMPQFTTATLSDAQLQTIFTFLAAFPKPTTGAALFRDFCANCHGANAAGGVTMRPIATEPMTAFMTNVRNGHSAGMFSNRREFMPKWTATQITDAEIRLIFTYVDSL